MTPTVEHATSAVLTAALELTEQQPEIFDLAFTAVTLWAYSGKRRDAFAEAANLPFADEPKPAVSRIQA